MHATEMVDEYIMVRKQRLAADKAAAVLKARETELQQELITHCQESATGGVFGAGRARVAVVHKVEPVLEDWNILRANILQSGDMDLLQKRINATAIKLRWEDGVSVPGVGQWDVFKLSISEV